MSARKDCIHAMVRLDVSMALDSIDVDATHLDGMAMDLSVKRSMSVTQGLMNVMLMLSAQTRLDRIHVSAILDTGVMEGSVMISMSVTVVIAVTVMPSV